MNILTVYTSKATDLLNTLDSLLLQFTIKVTSCDPYRLYNDDNHDDVTMAAVTFWTESTVEEVAAFINTKDVFVCQENPADWA